MKRRYKPYRSKKRIVLTAGVILAVLAGVGVVLGTIRGRGQ